MSVTGGWPPFVYVLGEELGEDGHLLCVCVLGEDVHLTFLFSLFREDGHLNFCLFVTLGRMAILS